MRRLATWALRLLVIAALLASISIGMLATHPGQSALLALISWLASDDETIVTLGPLEGSIFSKARFTKISVADGSGEWLVIHNASFDWHPAKLLTGRLQINEIDVALIDVFRKPKESRKSSQSSNGRSLPRLPPISIDRLNVSEIALSDVVIGTAARFKFSGAAHLYDRTLGADAELKLDRLDASETTLTAAFNYRPDQNQLALNVQGYETPGGLVAQIAGLPSSHPLSVSLEGNGILDAWRGTLSLQASDSPFIAGTASIDRVSSAYAFTLRMDGYLNAIAPQGWRDILSGKTIASLSGIVADNGRFDIAEVAVSNDAIRMNGSSHYEPQNGTLTAKAHLNISRADNRAIVLPIESDAQLSIASADLTLDLPATSTAATLAIHARSIGSSVGSIDQFELNGELSRSSHHPLKGPFKVTASAQRMKYADPQLAAVVGETAQFSAQGKVADTEYVDISALDLRFATGNAQALGTLKGGEFKGQAQINATDLKPLLKLVEIDAAGTAALDARGALALDGTSFDIAINGNSPSLTFIGTNGVPRAFGSLGLSFNANRSDNGAMSIQNADVTSKSFKARGQLTLGSAKLDAQIHAELSDLAAISENIAGKATLTGNVSGPISDLRSQFVAESPSITVSGRELTGILLELEGAGPVDQHAVQANVGTVVSGHRLDAQSRFKLEADALNLDIVELDWGALTVRGQGRLSKAESEGKFRIEHGNLSQLSPLAGSKLSGKMIANVDLVKTDNGPATLVKIVSGGASYNDVRIGKIDVAATVPINEPLKSTEAKVQIGSITAGKIEVSSTRIDVTKGQTGLRFAMTTIADDARLTLGARLNSVDEAIVVTLDELQANRHGKALKLAKPATIKIHGDAVAIRDLTIQSRDGRLNVDGEASNKSLDLNVNFASMPAELLDMIDQSIGAKGRLNGSARILGPTEKPVVDLNIAWQGASAQSVAQLGLPPVDLRANGRLAESAFSARLDTSGQDGLAVTTQVKLTGKSYGTLNGTVSGRVPLQIANAMLAERDTRLSGIALVNAQLGGSRDTPKLDGEIRFEDATVRDANSGTTLQKVNGTARITETALQIASVRGIGDKGGEVSLHGAISWSSPSAKIDALTITLDRLKIDDKKQVSGELDGSLVVNGPIDNLMATGRIDLKRLDVLVPEQLPRSVAALNLKHVNAPPQFTKRSGRNDEPQSQGGNSIIGLQIVISALDRISIRGRGLDAMLGGELKLRGTSNEPVAEGAFQLVQGRLSLLGRQLDFERGTAAFAGTLEPYLDMEAVAEADGVTITVTVSGPASRPEFKFSSQPDLPDDEILARLVFNKSLIKLTPMQIAQLASEVDKIGGLTSGPGMLDKLKSTIGIDRLDVTSEKNGDTAISAGSYVGDSTYVGVRQGLSAGSSRIIIDHDLTKNLKARGEVGADGNSKLGIGVEWDY